MNEEMTKAFMDELAEMNLNAVVERLASFDEEVRNATEPEIIEERIAMKSLLEERKVELEALEQRTIAVNEIENGAMTNIVEERKIEMEIEKRNTPEYINAFAEYIKSGNDTECRALLSENGSGNVAVPGLVYEITKHAWEKEGIMSLVRKSYLQGNLKVGFEISSTGATVHTESTTAVDEETLVLGIVTMVPKSIKKWISVSDEVMDLRGEAFLTYIYEELAYQIAHKAADELLAKIEACGTQSTTTSCAVPVITEASVAVGTIAKALGNLSDECERPAIVMNKATWSVFKAAQYANGYAVDVFENCPVLFNNSITAFSAATTGVTYAIVGDFGHGALANFPNGEGIDFKFDDKTEMTKDLVRVLGREYVAVDVVAPKAFVKIQK